jgi:hypothetical protein
MAEEPTGGSDRYAVLEVFGLKLEVSNPRLAELLTMSAREVLTSDVMDLMGGRASAEEIAEAVPDSVVAAATPPSDENQRQRRDFRDRVDRIGIDLGFDVSGDGTWTSPTGIQIVTRTVERPLTLAAAVHFVNEVAALGERQGEDSAVLFVVEGQQTADVFKVAIRQRRLYHVMRTVSLDNLHEIAGMKAKGQLDHGRVVVLVAPIADIDVGEILSVIHADEGEVSSGSSSE